MQPFQFPGRTFTIELDGESALHRLMELAAREGVALQPRHPDLTPFTVNLSPQSLGQAQDQIEELERGLIAREVAAGPDRPAQLGVQGLDGVGGVDDPADVGREGEERDHRRPVAPGFSTAICPMPPAPTANGFRPRRRQGLR